MATKKKTAKKSKKTRKSNKPAKAGKVLYPEYKVELCIGEKGLTHTKAKKLLGWLEDGENVKFGGEALLTDDNGHKVRCTNNVINRPLYFSHVLTLVQDILTGKWKFNFDGPIIISKTGKVLNGQHTLVAIIIANQIWEKMLEYKAYHKTPPTIDKMLCYGLEETDEVVNTMDTCKPRSLTDVIYRSKFFAKMNSADRLAVSRACDYSIRILWDRTGAKHDAHTPRRTHSEALDFIDRHPKLLDCVKFVVDEGKGLAKYLSQGYLSGLLYLFASCESDQEAYAKEHPYNESALNFDHWDSACDFLSMLSGGAAETQAVSTVIGDIEEEHGGISFLSRCAILVNSFTTFLTGKEIMEKSIKPKYHRDSDDIVTLIDNPTVGGIDLGPDPTNSQETINQDATEPDEDEKEAIEERKRAEKKNRQVNSTKGKARKEKKAKNSKSKDSDSTSMIGKTVWVDSPKDGLWHGTLLEYDGTSKARVRIENGHKNAGKTKKVSISLISTTDRIPSTASHQCM